MGRPAIKIDDEICAKAETLAAQGLTKKQIASALDMSYETLRVKKRAFSAFSAAIDAGRDKGITVATNALFKKLQAGDLGAIKYYLNNSDPENWAERREIDLTGTITTHEDRLKHLR